ncbi:Cation/multidrug efflux pump [Hahella chejuensis KCTC 2396]|uniref:Cation/multidrug efflux pump n=1 Tax=Hahella chejuensis (strain KCTC 2396) TaxID=349521 RepID=Q2SJ41_HAHCH|nr:hypothetical protein [Hahella chejuensis]ABC29333.1 Cation/multidrug efflux pump [Hahella chejuensis KCTC 2396]
MLYSGISIALVAIAILTVFICLRLLFRKSWFLVWLKGTMTFVALLFAVFLCFLALDMYRYKAYQQETTIATLSMQKLGDQLYRVKVAAPPDGEYSFDVSGDLWQLDARLVSWSGPFSALGMQPGYRLERISGRYYSLEQENDGARTVFAIAPSDIGFDFWAWLNSHEGVPWVDAKYGSATYLPMRDGAIFTVSIGNDGLIARPVNTPAVEAVEMWQ